MFWCHWRIHTAGRMQVYRGLLEHVQPVAIKVIPAGIVGATPRASAETLREITLLRQCRCPHIVQARRWFCSEGCWQLCLCIKLVHNVVQDCNNSPLVFSTSAA